MVSAAVHLLLLYAFLASVGRELNRPLATADPTGPSGGGNGGGSNRVGYITLPAYSPPVSASGPAAIPPKPAVALPAVVRAPVPAPVPIAVVDTPVLAAAPSNAQPGENVNAALRGGSGPGDSGAAGGAGMGAGTGTGPGAGTAAGPGTGGRSLGPVNKQMILPPDDAPKEVRGREIVVTFWVQADGKVQRVEISPEIKDRDYARKFLERMQKFEFRPGRAPDGTPIPGTYSVTVRF